MTLSNHQCSGGAPDSAKAVFGVISSNEESVDQPARSPAPRFYRDEQLFLPKRFRPCTAPGTGIVAALLDASSVDEREQLVRHMLRAIGFEWLSYGAVSLQNGHPLPLSFFTSYANPEWTECYFSQGYHELDSRQSTLPTSGLPLAWDVSDIETAPADLFAGDQTATKRARFAAGLRTCGIGSGLLFRVGSPAQLNEYTVVSLQSKARRGDWCSDSVVGQGLILGLSLHEYLSLGSTLPPELSDTRVEMPAMSSRQQYILKLLLQGRSDKEIAYRLKLSAHTVDYHMRQLRRRFAARNRVQLVTAASHFAQHGHC
jgi:DNA-binding CsgD family transcriptional regulator